ncbi:MAG: hypothetical protein BGO07_02145 [Alphaproteobacteria bacterium 40-19]|nr:MAG: hypothetical protein BGO07_02145 [Alphaproteobacteria bacterium 40-19]
MSFQIDTVEVHEQLQGIEAVLKDAWETDPNIPDRKKIEEIENEANLSKVEKGVAQLKNKDSSSESEDFEKKEKTIKNTEQKD